MLVMHLSTKPNGYLHFKLFKTDVDDNTKTFLTIKDKRGLVNINLGYNSRKFLDL
jgi:hypothetical protein